MKNIRHEAYASSTPNDADPTARPAIPTPAPDNSASATPARLPAGRSTPIPPANASAAPIKSIDPYIVMSSIL